MGSASSASTSGKFSKCLVATVKLSCTSCIGWIGAKNWVGDITSECMNSGYNIGPGASLQDRRFFGKTSNPPL